jgi:plasmid stabilization system protein ParE
MTVADVILTARAEADIDRAVRYLRRRAPLAAGPWLVRLLAAIESLSSNPERFAVSRTQAPGGDEYREMLFGRRKGTFRILYRVTPNAVFVNRVVRASNR